VQLCKLLCSTAFGDTKKTTTALNMAVVYFVGLRIGQRDASGVSSCSPLSGFDVKHARTIAYSSTKSGSMAECRVALHNLMSISYCE
jgi:hypothetical protein